MADTARLPGVHPQWLLFFPVVDAGHSVNLVRALGGYPLEPMQTSTGDLVVPCNDSQGAAFALYQPVG